MSIYSSKKERRAYDFFLIGEVFSVTDSAQLNPGLALLLCHDLLLTKGGIAASKDHVLKLAVTRHKARLNAEFTRARVRAGFNSIPEWKSHLESSLVSDASDLATSSPAFKHPRWVRINTIRSTLDEQLKHATFKDWPTVASISALCKPDSSSSSTRLLYADEHVPDLVATPAGTDLSKCEAYRSGSLIFQEKASCFPAYLLDPQPSDGDFIDACAAPGNKTTHLAALLQLAQARSGVLQGVSHSIFACERDATRSLTLQKMVRNAGASAESNGTVHVLPKQDFLKLDPQDKRFRNVGALLLDPSCSGSGIVGRDDGDDGDVLPPLVLPKALGKMQAAPENPRKRKRGGTKAEVKSSSQPAHENGVGAGDGENGITPEQEQEKLAARLTALAGFQLTLLKRAFTFPAARKIVYSTCSIHAAENEGVTVRALASGIARSRGWRILRRGEQVDGMKRWRVRGDEEAVKRLVEYGISEGLSMTAQEMREVSEACLRCEKGTIDGTMGFFAVGFVRDDNSSRADGKARAQQNDVMEYADARSNEEASDGAEEDEWAGFDSDE